MARAVPNVRDVQLKRQRPPEKNRPKQPGFNVVDASRSVNHVRHGSHCMRPLPDSWRTSPASIRGLTPHDPPDTLGQNVQQNSIEMKSSLSPKELGAAIGVSESSLKRWADSGRLHVARTAGGHRRIHLSEAVRFIRESGFSVERPDLIGLDDLVELEPGATRADPAEQFFQALIEGQGERVRGLALALYLEGTALAGVIDRMVAPAMRRVGELWQHSPEGIFVEHRASDLCAQALNRIRGLAPAPAGQPHAIGGAPENDPYVLPSLMAASVLATEGWSEANLGAHTPLAVLAQAAADCDARIAWLALSVAMPPARLRETVEQMSEALRAHGARSRLVVGGPALAGRTTPAIDGVYFAGSMAELSAFARGLRAVDPPPSPAPGNPDPEADE